MLSLVQQKKYRIVSLFTVHTIFLSAFLCKNQRPVMKKIFAVGVNTNKCAYLTEVLKKRAFFWKENIEFSTCVPQGAEIKTVIVRLWSHWYADSHESSSTCCILQVHLLNIVKLGRPFLITTLGVCELVANYFNYRLSTDIQLFTCY